MSVGVPYVYKQTYIPNDMTFNHCGHIKNNSDSKMDMFIILGLMFLKLIYNEIVMRLLELTKARCGDKGSHYSPMVSRGKSFFIFEDSGLVQ